MIYEEKTVSTEEIFDGKILKTQGLNKLKCRAEILLFVK